MSSERDPDRLVRSRSSLTAAMPAGWVSAEMLVMASPDDTTRVEAQLLPLGTLEGQDWRTVRIEQLSALDQPLEISSDLTAVEIDGRECPAVAFTARLAADDVTAGLSVLLFAGRSPVMATVTSANAPPLDEMVTLIERADVVAPDDAIPQAFEALAPDGATAPDDESEQPPEAQWRDTHAAWARDVASAMSADSGSADGVLVVATPEEIATLAAVAGCPTPVGLDLSWVGALDGDARRGVVSTAARALLARQVLGRNADGSLGLPDELADALRIAAEPGLMIETQHIDTDGVATAALVLAQPHRSIQITMLSHEARALSTFPTTQLVDRLVGAVTIDDAPTTGTISTDAIEAHFAGAPDQQITSVVGPEAALHIVRTFHPVGEGWGGSLVRWIRSHAGTWQVDEHPDGWSLTPVTRADLASRLLQILPGDDAT